MFSSPRRRGKRRKKSSQDDGSPALDERRRKREECSRCLLRDSRRKEKRKGKRGEHNQRLARDGSGGKGEGKGIESLYLVFVSNWGEKRKSARTTIRSS